MVENIIIDNTARQKTGTKRLLFRNVLKILILQNNKQILTKLYIGRLDS